MMTRAFSTTSFWLKPLIQKIIVPIRYALAVTMASFLTLGLVLSGHADVNAAEAAVVQEKTLYFQRLSNRNLLTFASPQRRYIQAMPLGGSLTYRWDPALARNVKIPAGSVIRVSVRAFNFGFRFRQRVTLLRENGEEIGRDEQGANGLSRTMLNYEISIPDDVNLAKGEVLELVIRDISLTGVQIIAQNTSNSELKSQVIIPIEAPVVALERLEFFEQAFPDRSPITSLETGDTFYLRTRVSDSINSENIGGTRLTIRDPSGAIVLDNVDQNQVDTETDRVKIFETEFVVPASSAPNDAWTAEVAALDSLDGEVLAVLERPFFVGTPELEINKAVSTLNARPGQRVTYQITVTNPRDVAARNVTVRDVLSLYEALATETFTGSGNSSVFRFIDSNTNPSGLVLGIPRYYRDNVVVDEGSLVRPIDPSIKRWELPFTGVMAPQSSFIIEYQSQVQ